MKKIDTSDERFVYLSECTDTKAVEQGATFRCWMNDADMGGWKGDDIYDFYDAIKSELKSVDKSQWREAFNECAFYTLK